MLLRPIVKFLFSILVFILIVDPADLILHLKTPVFLLIFFVWFIIKFNSGIKYNKDYLLLIGILILISFFGVLSAFFQNEDVDYPFAVGFIKSISILSLLIVVTDLNIEPDRYLNKLAIVIPLIIIPIFYIYHNYYPLFNVIYFFLDKKDVAMFSLRRYFGYDLIMLFYKTSPILVFPLSYFVSKAIVEKLTLRNLLLSITFFSTLLLSGTRANILSAILIVVYYGFYFLKRKRNAFYTVSASFLFGCASAIFLLSLNLNEKEQSAQVKAGHLHAFLDSMSQNPQYLLWGQGLGSKLYSGGFLTTQTELTYFDLIRFFGLPLFIVFIFVILYPIIILKLNRKINNRNRYSIVAFISYLFIAGTNPLLVSSTGILILIVMYSFLNKSLYQKIDEKNISLHSNL